MRTKLCRICGKEKPRNARYWHPRPSSADGWRNECRECVRLRQAVYNKTPERKAARYARESELRRTDPEWREKQDAPIRQWRADQRAAGFPWRKEYERQPEVKARIVHERAENYQRHKSERLAYKKTPRYRAWVLAYEQRRRADPITNARIRTAFNDWRSRNLEDQRRKAIPRAQKRRALLRGQTEHFTVADLDRILAEQDGICFYCDVDLIEEADPTVDHFIPLSRDGTNAAENIRLACKPCNVSKGNKMPDEFTPKIRRY
jgi:5-methylcytosine-specific restriction endonuclease McrA